MGTLRKDGRLVGMFVKYATPELDRINHGADVDLTKTIQPMLATLTYAPFLDHAGWILQEEYDCFRMVPKIEDGKVTLYSRNGKIISYN